MDLGDIMTFVILDEHVEYTVNGVTESADIEHHLTILRDENGSTTVVSDGYVEDITGFESCSYVSSEPDSEPDNENIQVATTDLRDELIAWAESQVGYLEKASNKDLDDFTANAGSADYTKYGQWYGINPGAWCAMFVSWCAHMAEVSTDVLPKYSSCSTGLKNFKDLNCFYYSSAYGGSYTPKYGDLFFIGSSKTASNHTGIVVSVSGTTITVVDGNYSNKVSKHTYKLTDSSLVGFASPNY